MFFHLRCCPVGGRSRTSPQVRERERDPVTLERKRNPRGKKLTACLPAASFLVINDWETKTEGARRARPPAHLQISSRNVLHLYDSQKRRRRRRKTRDSQTSERARGPNLARCISAQLS